VVAIFVDEAELLRKVCFGERIGNSDHRIVSVSFFTINHRHTRFAKLLPCLVGVRRDPSASYLHLLPIGLQKVA